MKVVVPETGNSIFVVACCIGSSVGCWVVECGVEWSLGIKDFSGNAGVGTFEGGYSCAELGVVGLDNCGFLRGHRITIC